MADITMTAPFSSVGANAIFDGNGHTITINNVSGFPGLFSAAVTVKNLGILSSNSTLAENAGWFFQQNIGGGSATNCYSTGAISENGGGIFGRESTGTATNCYSTGDIGMFGGGIFGNFSSGTATNCYSTGTIGQYGGGIFGYFSSVSAIATNCYSTGAIGQYGGGIIGDNSSGTATNCYSTGDIGREGGGIFGYLSSVSAIATNCYSTGTIGEGGGIFGYYSSGSATLSGHSDGWIDACANQFLVGDPEDTAPPRVWMINTNYNISGPDKRPYIFYVYIPCFVAGTHIMTATGYRAVETLTATDRIMTADNRALPFKLYTTTVKCTSSETAPYKIPKGAFAHNSPPQDITLSPHHAIQVRKGVWQIPKYAALSYSAIKQVNVGEEVHYFHIEMPNFFTDNIIAEGSVVESYAAKQVTNVKNVYKFNTTLNGFTRVSQRLVKTPKL